MNLDDIILAINPSIGDVLRTLHNRHGYDSSFVFCVCGFEFVGRFTMHDDTEYITLENPETHRIYHDVHDFERDMTDMIRWIATEVQGAI